MPGCGGVRKLRVPDPSRGKGTRGGLRGLFLDLPHREVTYLLYAYGKAKRKLRRSIASRKRKGTIESGLLRGMEEALAHSKGNLSLKETKKELPGPAPTWSADEIRHLRKEVFSYSQEEFAALLNVKTPTVRSWEQGQKLPSGSAARLLEVLSKDRSIPKKLSKVS